MGATHYGKSVTRFWGQAAIGNSRHECKHEGYIGSLVKCFLTVQGSQLLSHRTLYTVNKSWLQLLFGGGPSSNAVPV
jgi:hypothetical protein